MAKSQITLNVLENITNRVKDAGFSNNSRKALIVFNGSYLDNEHSIKDMLYLKENGFDISIGFSYMAERVIDTKMIIEILKPSEIYREEDIINFPNIIEMYFILVCPNVTINTLSKVSLGMIDSFVPNVIWTFLYEGKQVYLDFHSVRRYLGKETKSKEILNIIDNHIKTVEKMGAIEIDKCNYLKNIISSKEIKCIDIKKDLITEKDIIKFSDTTKIISIEKGTVVTPLAKDKARELGIIIEKN